MPTTKSLRGILTTFDVLLTFEKLPVSDQEKFTRWIGLARDSESHWLRVEALVLALRVGPLASVAPEGPAGNSEVVG